MKPIVAIVKTHKEPTGKDPRVHAQSFEKTSPQCGGGKDASKNKAWQVVAGGISAVNCKGCLTKLVKLAAEEKIGKAKAEKKRAAILKEMEVLRGKIQKLEAQAA